MAAAAAASAAAAAAAAEAEEERSLLANFGAHRLMDNVQAVLKRQLAAALTRAEAELRQQQEAREGARRAREEVGVELYGVQQQLAHLQAELEGRARGAEELQAVRAQREAELRRFQATHAERRAAAEEHAARLEKAKGELDGVLDTVRQVEGYNAEMAAEIQLTRRATQKAGQDMGEKEKAKAAQDLYIDHLSQQVKRAAEQLALLTQQGAAQRNEAAAAAATMAEAAQEMETIRFEKKQLLMQWQSSLVAMRRRDEAILAMQKAAREAQDEVGAMDAEEGNLRKGLAAAQAEHARLQDALDRIEADLKNTEAQSAQLGRQHSALEERRADLSGTLDTTDAEVRRVMAEQVRLVRLMKEADNVRMAIDKQRFGVEAEIDAVLDAKLTNEKAGKALLRDAAKLVERSQELDVQSAEAENAVAAAKVEALNTASRLSALRDARGLREAELLEKERLVAQYEVENKQRLFDIDKKMAVVERLNRKWEKMVASAPEAENMGPLQAEVHNARKQIDAVREDCEALQRRWLGDQTALVAAANEAEVRLTRLTESSAQASLLEQKRVRLDSAIAAHRGELRRLEGGVKAMHDDMARINALIARNDELGKRLAGNTFTSERAFSAELRDLELECAAADARLESVRSEKARLLEDLVECERQAILWEKKIALERETQEALDPSAGESELQAMEREINRMRNRYDALRRDQERLVKEMERAIEKRDVIANKHRSSRQATMDAAATVARGMAGGAGAGAAPPLVGAAASSAKAAQGAELTRVGLQHKASTLRKTVATRLAQSEELEGAPARAGDAARAVSGEAAARQAEIDALEERARSLQRDVHVASYEKQKAIERLQGVLRFHQRLEALDAGKLPAVSGEEAQHVRARLHEAEVARDTLQAVIDQLAAQHADLAEVLARVAQLTEVAPAL
jgi:chromosome segregation ATPase